MESYYHWDLDSYAPGLSLIDLLNQSKKSTNLQKICQPLVVLGDVKETC
jgi:hypothetical protein